VKLDFGLIGIWGAAVVYVVLLATVMIWKFRSGDWKAIKV
jgi:Na+-driven multidrug efflux pump